jgi:hypothetical protein
MIERVAEQSDACWLYGSRTVYRAKVQVYGKSFAEGHRGT